MTPGAGLGRLGALCIGAVLIAGEPARAATSDADAPAGSLARSRFLMGTRLSIEVIAPSPGAAIEAAFAEVQRLDGVLSNWRSDSELARLNRDAANEDVPCTEDLFRAVQSAIDWARRTDGAFDPTVEPLGVWFGLRGPEGRIPGTDEPLPAGIPGEPVTIDREGAARLVDWRGVRLHRRTRTIRFDRSGMGLDLGGIGKGQALDAALRVLQAHGVRSALLDFGGQLLAYGVGPDDGGFRVGVAQPDARDGAAVIVRLRNASISTSGNSERGVPAGRGGGGHLLDPATGAPAGYTGSVSVMAPTGADADALSTALFVMGPERGLAWAERHGVDVLYLERDAAGSLNHRGTGVFFRGLQETADDPVSY